MDLEEKKPLKERMAPLTMIWISIIFSVVIGAAAVLFLVTQGDIKPALTGEEADILVITLAAMAVVMIAVGHKIGPMFILPGYIRDRSLPRSPDEAGGDFWVKSEEDRALTIFPKYFQVCIIRWAFFEGVGMLGLVCALLTEEGFLPHAGAFLAVSVALLAISRPSLEELYTLAGRTGGLGRG